MKFFWPILFFVLSFNAFAESKLSADLTIDDLKFVKPVKGVGRAGTLVFKSANVNTNGIILNLNNVNKLFDSQIFLRPTFLGFTTQFGNYGMTLEEGSLFNTINTLELKNSKFILDDNQLNLSGEHLKYVDPEIDVLLNNFRLYCQSPVSENPGTPPSTDMMKNCMGYLTLNGSYNLVNQLADIQYRSVNKLSGDKTFLEAKIKNIDVRSDKMIVKMGVTTSVSNDNYIIKAQELDFSCAKDPLMGTINSDKLMKDCLNEFKMAPLKANLNDKVAKTSFDLDIKDVTVKNKIVYLALNSGALSDAASTTSIYDMLLNCKKDTDTDVLELMQVLRDCTSYSRISIGEVKSTKPDDSKGSSVKKIAVSVLNNDLIVQADVKLLGFNSRVSISGKVSVDETKRQLILTVTETKLPLGLTSVKLLMYFLKKNFISKDITFVNKTITVTL